ncbi:Tn3 family transposase, partial [Streptomyces sp. NPDC014820]|uniref:Tn3 family transposase n=1 Tax=Streptomyces sp. NPDC014820 TaxID=3364921 RepID=UPI0036FBA5C6
MENWNSVNKDLFYGKDGDLAAQDKEPQEVSMLAPDLLQSAQVHVNTLLMQQVLADPQWADTPGDAERRALSPLSWTPVNPLRPVRAGHEHTSRPGHDCPGRRAQAARPRGWTGGGPGVRSSGSDRLRTASAHQHSRRMTAQTGVHFAGGGGGGGRRGGGGGPGNPRGPPP